MKPIRILLVDDHSILRLGLATFLKCNDDLDVVGEAENGAEALARVRELTPDVVIMDLMMPVMDGVEATRRILAEFPKTRILLLTSYGTAAEVTHAITAGAAGALLKGRSDEELVNAVRKVAAGGSAYSPEIEQMLREEPVPPELTDRQIGILDSVTRGLTSQDIALQFGISPDAVNQHLSVIRDKLGAANRSEAVAIALRRHLLKS